MNAMIFAAGLGTRLRPLTDTIPKSLIEVGGMTMLDHAINAVIAAGATTVVVNVHHFASMIIAHCQSHTYKAKIIISDESDMLLDTGGGLAKAIEWFADNDNDPVIVHNADILTDINLRMMVDYHRRTHADVTLLTAPRESSRALLFDSADRMHGWINITTGETRPIGVNPEDFNALPFGGIHVISPETLHLLKQYSQGKTKFSITPFYIDMAGHLDIRSWKQPEGTMWVDIGRHETLALAREKFTQK